MKYYTILAISMTLILTNACDDEDGTEEIDSITIDQVTDGLVSPLVLVESPDNSGRLFVVDQPGQIYIIKDGSRLTEPFLNIQSKLIAREGDQDERGLLGLAFHPQFESNGRFFVYYSGPLQPDGPEGWDHTNYIAEFNVSSGNADMADIGTEQIVLAIDHPQSNHNAGMIAFGSDGYLYISVGDGGGGDDKGLGHVDDWFMDNAGGNGQDITQNLLGNILRIDVTSAGEYGIPDDNPFVNADGLDEIYAYGLRNPYRFCFDPTGKVILADAGQELFEEIDLIEKGGNYGWNIKEGRHCFDAENPTVPPGECPNEDFIGHTLVDPVIEFANSRSQADGLGTVSIGGYVYQGTDVISLGGKYLFGVLTQDPDAMNGAIFAADRSGSTWDYKKLKISNMPDSELDQFILGFGQDSAGEVYLLTNGGTVNSGKVYKINK